jgi:OmpA-OmpF porin, OOP family
MKKPALVMLAALTAIVLPFAPGLVLAQEEEASAEQYADREGSADHPAVPRFPGFYIDDYTQNDFNEHEFLLGFDKASNEEKLARKEGRYWYIEYDKKPQTRTPSPLEIQRNYERAFAPAGGVLVYNTQDRDRITFRQRTPQGERWIELQALNEGELIRVYVLEVSGMEQKVEMSAADMRDALARDGFVALNGILFDTGLDAIKPESEPLLNEVLALLQADPALRLSVEGHTDNVGAAAANQALSDKRAAAVRAWLANKGVAAARLQSKGYGASAPLADNRTEEGRAKNRRVELVKL